MSDKVWNYHWLISLTNSILKVWNKLTSCQRVCGQNANRTYCQPEVGIFSGLISVVGILSVPTFWLAFCPDHLNMFWHFVRIMKMLIQIVLTWFSWFRQNTKICWDGPDKMPTKNLGRTKCQPQIKVRTKCQPLVGIMSGWHFVRLAFCPHTACGDAKSKLLLLMLMNWWWPCWWKCSPRQERNTA